MSKTKATPVEEVIEQPKAPVEGAKAVAGGNLIRKIETEEFDEVSAEEWMALSMALEDHHSVFYKFWELGKPIFRKDIKTAGVVFNREDDSVFFYFNPDFWKALDFNTKLFVISHECLHAILNHGARIKDTENMMLANKALDVVVNHTLVSSFGFDRDDIKDWQNYCWTETMFPDDKNIPSDQIFEYYYNKLKNDPNHKGNGKCSGKHAKPGEKGDGQCDGSCQPQTVDEHQLQDDTSGLVDKLNEELTYDEKKDLKETVDKHFQPSPSKQAGTGTGGQWTFVPKKKIVRKKKWETVIHKWYRKALRFMEIEIEQWVHEARRTALLAKGDMFMPSVMEVEDYTRVKCKLDVAFFLDTSGSCWHLGERFFTAAESIPPDRFNIRLFNFATAVQETDLKSRKMYGGGGTYFHIIEDYIQKEYIGKGKKYPKAVFVITDGWGDRVEPKHPGNWYVFLTEGGSKDCFPKDVKVFHLKDFE